MDLVSKETFLEFLADRWTPVLSLQTGFLKIEKFHYCW